MNSLQIRKLTYAALLLALAVMMPRIAGLIPDIGKTLNLMHIPVLLCGFLCGWSWGLVVGFTAPLLSSLLNGMPGIFPDAVVMAFELAAYGALSGLLYRLLPKKMKPLKMKKIIGIQSATGFLRKLVHFLILCLKMMILDIQKKFTICSRLQKAL